MAEAIRVAKDIGTRKYYPENVDGHHLIDAYDYACIMVLSDYAERRLNG